MGKVNFLTCGPRQGHVRSLRGVIVEIGLWQMQSSGRSRLRASLYSIGLLVLFDIVRVCIACHPYRLRLYRMPTWVVQTSLPPLRLPLPPPQQWGLAPICLSGDASGLVQTA